MVHLISSPLSLEAQASDGGEGLADSWIDFLIHQAEVDAAGNEKGSPVDSSDPIQQPRTSAPLQERQPNGSSPHEGPTAQDKQREDVGTTM